MSLTNRDAQAILGMLARGDKQHNVAAWFGENQARIVEVEKGSHGNLQPLPAEELPPKGAPGPKGRLLRGSVNKAMRQLESGDVEDALNILKLAADKYDSHQG